MEDNKGLKKISKLLNIYMELQIDSPYLQAGADVKDGEHVVFKDEGELTETKFGEKLNITVSTPMAGDKILTLNTTSRNNMVKLYGTDTKKWIGKEARANVMKNAIGGSGEIKTWVILTEPNKDTQGDVIIE